MTHPRELADALRNRTGYDLDKVADLIEAQAKVCDAARLQNNTWFSPIVMNALKKLDALEGKK